MAEERKLSQDEAMSRHYVIRSLSEGDVDLDGKVGAFWSNEDGWGCFETASRFTTAERMDSFLPISAGGDSEWMLYEEALDLTRKVPTAAEHSQKKRQLYVISGRIPGDDDDSVDLVVAEDESAAQDAFRISMTSDLSDDSIARLQEDHGTTCFVIESRLVGDYVDAGMLQLSPELALHEFTQTDQSGASLGQRGDSYTGKPVASSVMSTDEFLDLQRELEVEEFAIAMGEDTDETHARIREIERRMSASPWMFHPDKGCVLKAQNVSEATKDLGDATLFWRELSESVESLTELADQHGPRTLADLMYLQNAILSGGFIDHYPGESNVLEVVKALPSAERWLQFVTAEELETKNDSPSPGV